MKIIFQGFIPRIRKKERKIGRGREREREGGEGESEKELSNNIVSGQNRSNICTNIRESVTSPLFPIYIAFNLERIVCSRWEIGKQALEVKRGAIWTLVSLAILSRWKGL